VQPNKAIVGENAFAHEAGIHQDGVLKEKLTYEIMRPEDIGRPANKLVLGKHSGRAAFKQRLEELGMRFESEAEANQAFQRFKELADKKHEIYDEDLQALVSEQTQARDDEGVRLVDMETSSKTGARPSAAIALLIDGERREARGEGDGQVDAVFSAIEQLVRSGAELVLFSVSNITQGGDAQGEVLVRLRKDGRIVNGQGADTDIVVASAKAYLNAVNRLASRLPGRGHAQQMEALGTP